MRMRAQRHDGRRDIDRVGGIRDQPDMVEPCIVADGDDEGVMSLISLGPLGCAITLDQRGCGMLAEAQQRTREHRRRCRTGRDVDDMERL
jgi:hypothetical protein